MDYEGESLQGQNRVTQLIFHKEAYADRQVHVDQSPFKDHPYQEYVAYRPEQDRVPLEFLNVPEEFWKANALVSPNAILEMLASEHKWAPWDTLTPLCQERYKSLVSRAYFENSQSNHPDTLRHRGDALVVNDRLQTGRCYRHGEHVPWHADVDISQFKADTGLNDHWKVYREQNHVSGWDKVKKQRVNIWATRPLYSFISPKTGHFREHLQFQTDLWLGVQ